MKTLAITFKRSRLVQVAIVLVGITLVSVWSTTIWSNAQRESLPEFISKTSAFQFLSAKRTNDSLMLEMKNVSAKAVVAYIVSFGRGLNIPTDYTIGEVVVAPGEIVQSEYPLSYLSNLKKEKVSISAVVFNDGSSEGDTEALAELKSEWLGEKIQLKHINRLLKQAMKSTDMDESGALAKVKSEISALPEDQEAGQSWHVREGLNLAKQRVLYLLNQLDQWYQQGANRQPLASPRFKLQGEISGIANISEGIGKIIGYQEKRIAKY